MKSKEISTQTWVWQAMIRSGLIPLVLVESVLIIVFIMSNHFISAENMNYIYKEANSELLSSANREASVIKEKLLSISRVTALYRNEVTRVLSETENNKNIIESNNLALSENGVLYSRNDLGGAASFYSSIQKIKDKSKIYKLSSLDSLMKQIKENNNIVASVYFNSWDSYNRIYPWFSTVGQYPSDMDIQKYNFYYLANKENNPSRDVVWTDVYIDPAGQGWMASSIAPVYNNDFLEGVVGLDVTVEKIINKIQHLSIPWNGYAILASNNGNIIALPPKGESDFNLKELTSYNYQQAINKEIFKPEKFNLFKHHDTSSISTVFKRERQGIIELKLNGRTKLAAWSTIPEINWKLLLIVDEEDIYAESRSLENKFQMIGYLLICGLVVFYTIFLIFIWFSSRRMSKLIAEPLIDIQNMASMIATQKFVTSHKQYKLKEINKTANSIVEMGLKLGRLTDELIHSKLKAENASISKNQFISNISHEIRTPMNSIIGMSHLLLNSQLTNDQRENINIINTASKHLLSLINNVLDLSRLDAGELQVEHIPFKLSAIIQDVYDIFGQRAQEKKLNFLINVDDGLPETLIGDPLRIKQILINYIGNAIKFTSQGEILLRVRMIKKSTSAVRLCFCVKDSGIGLSKEEQQKVFVRFKQADAATTRKYGGSGLGLAICQHLASIMDGSVGVKSHEGEGSTFWLQIELELNNTSNKVAKTIYTQTRPVIDNTIKPLPNINIYAIATKLEHLNTLLNDNDLEAGVVFSDVKHDLGLLFPELSNQLSKYISEFSYDCAIDVLKQIRNSIL